MSWQLVKNMMSLLQKKIPNKCTCFTKTRQGKDLDFHRTSQSLPIILIFSGTTFNFPFSLASVSVCRYKCFPKFENKSTVDVECKYKRKGKGRSGRESVYIKQ